MPEFHNSFVHLLFIGLIALFPVVNPIGSAFIVNPYLSNLTKDQKKQAVKKITIYAFFICLVSLFAGHWILELFGISIPIVQIAGGIMICKMGWEFLSSDKSDTKTAGNTDKQALNSDYEKLQDQLFFPLTFPITTGAGTVSVLFTLSAHSADKNWENYFTNISAIILSILIMCSMVYFFYLNTKTIIHYLGSNGEKIVNRITAFLIFCVGLQIAVTGIKSLHL